MSSDGSDLGKAKRVDDEKFDAEKELINQDIANTLERVINDYANHWKGVLGEVIQNSYDAWCTNRFERDVIPEDQPLEIHFSIDINKREITAVDNAGGMPSINFYERFAGLDTPGDEKEGGGTGGAYGRGFHVVSGAGEETHAETRHGSFHGGLVVRGPYQMKNDDLDNLSNQGTWIQVKDVKTDLLLRLTDRDRVHEHIQARFQRMLEHDDVSVKITIDGETQEVEPVDLSQFEILWEGDIPFEHNGEEKKLTDAVVYKKDGQDVPFEGMSMTKRNEHMDRTFMRVKQYRPRRISHLEKMFGFCDASVLCPEYENNAHTGWVGGVLPAGIKRVFERIEREEFIGGPTEIKQRDEIVQTAMEMLTDQWGEENPFDVATDASDLDIDLAMDDEPTEEYQEGEDEPDDSAQTELPREEPDVGVSPDDEEEMYVDTEDDDEELPEETEIEPESDPEPVLKCRTRTRTFDVDETVDIRVLVENPGESEISDFEVEGELENDEGEVRDLEPRDLSVPTGESSGGVHGWEIGSGTDGGKFVFRAELHPKGETAREIDTTNTYFFVGTAEEEAGEPRHTFLEDIEFYPEPGDKEFRYELQEGNEALVLLINPSHPEYRYSEKLDGRNDTENQVATVVRWGQESIMNYLLMDQLESKLQDQIGEDGEPLDEELTQFVRNRMIDDLSSFTAQTYEGLN